MNPIPFVSEGSECPECGEIALRTEYVGGNPRRRPKPVSVCSECGSVLDRDENEDESNLCDIYRNESGTEVVDFEDEFGKDSGQNSASSTSNSNQTSNGSVIKERRNDGQWYERDEYKSTEADLDTSRECELCHGHNVMQELVKGTEQFVCRDCGWFVEEDSFVSTREVILVSGQTDTTYGWVRAPKPKFTGEGRQPPEGKIVGISAAKSISRALNLNADFTEQAVKLYEKIYEKEKVKNASISLKEAIGATCAYFVARENNVQVTLNLLQSQCGKDIRLLTKALRAVENETNQGALYQSLESLVTPVLAKASFSLEFLDKVGQLVIVCEKGWITQGRKQSNIIVPVAYLVWQAEDVPGRFKRCLADFCAEFTLKYTRNAADALQFIRNLLITLAEQLPWVKPPVDKRKMLFHVNDIIEYQLSVFSKVGESEGIQNKAVIGSSDSTTDLSLPLLHPPSMKRRMAEIDPKDLKMHLPQGMTCADLDKPELAESEFEEEISLYLSTEQEVQAKKKCLEQNHPKNDLY